MMRRAIRVLAWTAGILAGVIVALALVVMVFPWDTLRGPLGRRLSDTLGRTVVFDGQLSAHFGRTSQLVAEGVHIANTSWGSEPRMLEIKRLSLSLSLPSLLRGRLAFPELRLEEPNLLLEKNREGEANWHFVNPQAAAIAATVPTTRTEVPIIDHIVIEEGHIAYREPARNIDIDSRVNTAVGGGSVGQSLHIAGSGTFQKTPFHLVVEGGAIEVLRDDSSPYPLHIEAHVGDTKASVTGTITDPLQMSGVDLEMHLSGQDMAATFPIFGIPIPHTPAYALVGRLQRQGDIWAFHEFSGRVGSSDLSGSLSVAPGQARAKLTATLLSQNLDSRDLSGFIGGRPGHDDASQSAERVLPNTPVNLDELRAMDMDVHFEGRHVQASGLPIDNLKARLVIDDGRAVLDPISFGLARGAVAGTVVLDGRQALPKASFDLRVDRVKFRDFFQGTRFVDQADGIIAGRVNLVGSGHSTAEILAHSDGRLAIFMGDGSFSSLAVSLVGLDIANALGLIATHDKPVAVRCMVADLSVHQGLAKADALVLDTTASAITGQGSINLGDESLDLRLSPHPKEATLLSARADVLVTGTFQQPSARIDLMVEAARGTAAAALAAFLTPLGALLPFIDLGLGEDSPCAQLIGDAKAGSAPARPPLPR
jgi:uncharacterized protein involved in outer membrane biogenesis